MPGTQSDSASGRPAALAGAGRDVTVSWHAPGTDSDEALRRHVAHVVGVVPEEVAIGRLCGRCGSSEHGRPWASHDVHVSLSRSGSHLLTAVSTAGPVGVDVESVVAAGDLAAARAWSRAEAVLKREGTGLATRSGEALPDDGAVREVEAPEGYCAAVACADR